MDYIIWVDADDLIDSFSMNYLLQLKKNDLQNYDMVIMPYRYHFDGEKDLYTLDRERILKRSLNLEWKGRIHECLPIKGNLLLLNNEQAYIIHNHQKPYGDRNLLIFQDMEKKEKLIVQEISFIMQMSYLIIKFMKMHLNGILMLFQIKIYGLLIN